MVSTAKRMRYVSENDFSSSEAEDYESVRKLRTDRRLKSKGKWLSKNAIMARENRLKKKLYILNLEKEVGELKTNNTNYSKVIENQSMLITDLRKEIKYLKSIIANSKDIGKLIRNIHQNTGMSVTTSVDQTLSLNDYVSKPKQAIARKTVHPWEEKQYPSYPTPESDNLNSSLFAEHSLVDFNDDLLKDVELENILGNSFVNPANLEDGVTDVHLKEHNYTSLDGQDQDDVGVCLHVSRHRVSLEFCSSCSEDALQAWNH